VRRRQGEQCESRGAASTAAARTNMPPVLKPEGASAAPAQPETRLVQPANPPPSLKVSPALSEIIKLAQAGVSET